MLGYTVSTEKNMMVVGKMLIATMMSDEGRCSFNCSADVLDALQRYYLRYLILMPLGMDKPQLRFELGGPALSREWNRLQANYILRKGRGRNNSSLRKEDFAFRAYDKAATPGSLELLRMIIARSMASEDQTAPVFTDGPDFSGTSDALFCRRVRQRTNMTIFYNNPGGING